MKKKKQLRNQRCTSLTTNMKKNFCAEKLYYSVFVLFQAGDWFYEITSPTDQQVTVTVTSKVSDRSVSPIQIRTRRSSSTLTTGEALVIQAEVIWGIMNIKRTIQSKQLRFKFQKLSNSEHHLVNHY